METRDPTEQSRRNMEIFNRRTSFALEIGIWDSLVEVCRREGVSIDELCETIISKSPDTSMASAIRIYTMDYFLALDEARDSANA